VSKTTKRDRTLKALRKRAAGDVSGRGVPEVVPLVVLVLAVWGHRRDHRDRRGLLARPERCPGPNSQAEEPQRQRGDRSERAGVVLAAALAHGSFRSRHLTKAGHSRLAWRRQPPVALQGRPDARCQPGIKLIPERPFRDVGERSLAESPVPLLKLLVVHDPVRQRSPQPLAQLVVSRDIRQLGPAPSISQASSSSKTSQEGGFLVAPGSGPGLAHPSSQVIQSSVQARAA
jgi:hypothetical protein